jgi:hypothetical protein
VPGNGGRTRLWKGALQRLADETGPPKTHRYFPTPYGWKVARFSRLEARVFRPAVAVFTSHDAVPPFPLRASLNRAGAPLDELIHQAFSQAQAS